MFRHTYTLAESHVLSRTQGPELGAKCLEQEIGPKNRLKEMGDSFISDCFVWTLKAGDIPEKKIPDE